MKESWAKGLAIAVGSGLVLAILGGVLQTYVDVQELKGKMDWLYRYTFPEAK